MAVYMHAHILYTILHSILMNTNMLLVVSLVIGECDINRCRNGGRCLKMAATHKCDCINGYGGMLCQNSKWWQ